MKECHAHVRSRSLVPGGTTVWSIQPPRDRRTRVLTTGTSPMGENTSMSTVYVSIGVIVLAAAAVAAC